VKLLLVVSLAITLGTVAQQKSDPPSSIDPVPDYVAFRLFFAAVAENSSPAPAEVARQNSRLDPIRLTAADKTVLVTSLSRFKTNLADAQRMPQGRSMNDVVQSTLAELIAQMSPNGFQRLYTHVRFQKKFMRVGASSTSQVSHEVTSHE